jgi:hypothetical protein
MADFNRRNIHQIKVPSSWSKHLITLSCFNEGSLTQVTFRSQGFDSKCWITHFAGTNGWSVAWCKKDELTARDQYSDMTKSQAIEAACSLLINGYC